MKYKTVLMFLLVSFIFTSTASAKINYNGVEITESHSATIRGFLYEMSNNALNVNIAQRWSPLFAKTLVWLEDKQRSETVDNLETFINNNCEEAKVVANTISVIHKVFRGEYGIDPEYAASHWYSVGQRVVAFYSYQNTPQENSNEVDAKREIWKLELRPRENRFRTRDLLYRAWL